MSLNRRWPKLRLSRENQKAPQRGSAVVEFVLISAPLVLLAITSISITISAFTLMILRDSAVEGARFAALADQNSAAGCLRAQAQVNATFHGRVPAEFTCQLMANDQELVQIRANFANLGLLGIHTLSATGRASRER